MAPEIREALCALCCAHGWSYGVCWRFDRRDPRTIGVVAISGKHQWISSDTSFEGNNEWQHQFLAGMKTIVVISLQSFGVVQFGSTEKICEGLEFIEQAQHMFRQQEDMKGHSLPGNIYPCEPFTSLNSSGNIYASHKNINSLHDLINKELRKSEPSTSYTSSNHYSLGSHNGIIDPYLSAIPVITSPQCASTVVSNPFFRINSRTSMSSFPVTSQSVTASYGSSNQFTANLNANNLANELATSAEQRMLPGLTANLHYSSSHMNSFQYHSGHSISLSSPAKSSSKSSSIASELPDNFLSLPQDPVPEQSASFQLKNHETRSQVDPCEHNIPSVQSEAISCSPSIDLPSKPVEISSTTGCDWKLTSSNEPSQLFLDNDLFEGMELDLSPRIVRQESWDDIITPIGSSRFSNLGTSVSDCKSEIDKELFSGSSFEQLLESVVRESANSSTSNSLISLNNVDCTQGNTKPSPLCEFNFDKIIQQCSMEIPQKSHSSSWIDGSSTMNTENAITNQIKKPEENVKVARKRARPGESTRPRPKDRQAIQDRVKELREIVPNSSKCSIDTLLDRTIKHMLFLQSVTKYADKLKLSDEPKMIGNQSGVVLKDNSSSGAGSGGATWAYEVAGQTMVCPILVEDLNPPGQMLVEMLCEERGFFLEIADVIQGFGLTILKGVMEIRESKIWARFLIEANKDVTRMDIFFSLVQFLQQTSSIRTNEQQQKQTTVLEKKVFNTFSNYQKRHDRSPIAIADSLC
ncbi:transcription factor bHLH157-like isoform X2 [Asparagus officinalis]|uniref:transcription factor bHLH157-like isoform X2 n=1 Tax=Asparagus officinalis TaxID=4686 RepID=UPI00098E7752|nr:transcription factor bHLH157-like isoform X2 [Asparagus officinalis]